ncbi:MAG: site-2 protease family protein, partial [Acidobacteriota bacterium]
MAVLGSVVLFHEFGHYVCAKAFGITVEVFSIGFGKKIVSFVRR